MSKQRRQHSAAFKFRLALEAIKGERTVNELASEHGVHPTQISQWKRQLLFSRNGGHAQREQATAQAELYEQIDRLKMELEWLKKKLPSSIEAKRTLVEPGQSEISLRQQCELLGLNRSSLYYKAAGESAENLHLMRRIDEQYTQTPFYGWPRMTAFLRREGLAVNHKRVQRLMQKMGLQAIYPKPKTTVAAKKHQVYPYLLRGLTLTQPQQVWSADITYIPLRHGFMYLVAVIDWFSRYVLAWQLSNTLDSHFCVDALQLALCQAAPVPEDAEFFGILFKVGSFMPHFPVSKLVNSFVALPEASSNSFWLNGSAWEFPNYENAETFVARLVRKGLLVHEPIVSEVLQGQQPAFSLRSVQRRFLQATGLTHNTIQQIKRARRATLLLQQQVSILDTVHEAGYFDQPHLTKSLKHFIGQTPAQLLDQETPKQLSLLYNTTSP